MTFTRTWRVGHRWACLAVEAAVTGPALGRIVWSHTPPRQWSADELEAYGRGRNAALAALAAELGERPILILSAEMEH